jgi:hypothetical protein
MSESNEYAVDRSEWSGGPWDLETDDKVVWVDQETGLDCMMIRNGMGAWCGYVGLPPEHPDHGKDYMEVWGYDVQGGLTYSESCSGNVCHVPEEGRPHDVWWLGFDCSHSGDASPDPYRWDEYGTYRTQAVVRAWVVELAAQVDVEQSLVEDPDMDGGLLG